jgi:hypothetical protein
MDIRHQHQPLSTDSPPSAQGRTGGVGRLLRAPPTRSEVFLFGLLIMSLLLLLTGIRERTVIVVPAEVSDGRVIT